ncbi:MAG: NAD(P)/FAD-dependent oxidoreductase [Woeseiaceae bacterium]
MTRETINIVGAGQCGTLMALMLARHGYQVEVYERFRDPRIEDPEAGRSINLALAARGLNALRQVGIDALVQPLLVPMRGRMVHGEDGRTEFLPYGQQRDEEIYSVTRLGLNQILLGAADKLDNLNLNFEQNAIGYDAPDQYVHVRDERDGTLYQVAASPLIAADGAGSNIRRSFDGTGTFGGIENLLSHGYKELAIPAGPDGQFQLDPGALHIWPRGGFMLIALPNPGGDFTLTLFLPNTGENSFEQLTDEQAVVSFFETNFPDAAALIPNLVEDVLDHPLGILGTVRCRHWHDRGNVLLVGDAAHAIVPFHGQGMNLAFEDCVLLDRIITELGSDWASVDAGHGARSQVCAAESAGVRTRATTAGAFHPAILDGHVPRRHPLPDRPAARRTAESVARGVHGGCEHARGCRYRCRRAGDRAPVAADRLGQERPVRS